MKYKNYNDLTSRTLNQISMIYTGDKILNKRSLAHLLLDIYFDAESLPNEDIQRREALEEILTPLFKAGELLASPPRLEREE